MRLLHAGDADRLAGFARFESEPERSADPRCDRRKPLPLHRISADRRSGAARGRAPERSKVNAACHNAFSPPQMRRGACEAGGVVGEVVGRCDQTTPALRATPPYPRRGNPRRKLTAGCHAAMLFPSSMRRGACEAGGVVGGLVGRCDQTTPALRATPPYPRRGNPRHKLNVGCHASTPFPSSMRRGACEAGGVVGRCDQTTPALRATPPYPRRGNPRRHG